MWYIVFICIAFALLGFIAENAELKKEVEELRKDNK